MTFVAALLAGLMSAVLTHVPGIDCLSQHHEPNELRWADRLLRHLDRVIRRNDDRIHTAKAWRRLLLPSASRRS
ncbi:hypothetical protein [Pseudomonas fluorescens]|uniref:hypothetical protein n=1 Tax=Pseudomonas fluorescens TaxID=294 RepID=UPI0027836794|nr:hypothetical protein [Pseudomonas fluorescens]MDP9780691.1 hypothetical protein [Pseudomonas fluorescens]